MRSCLQNKIAPMRKSDTTGAENCQRAVIYKCLDVNIWVDGAGGGILWQRFASYKLTVTHSHARLGLLQIVFRPGRMRVLEDLWAKLSELILERPIAASP